MARAIYVLKIWMLHDHFDNFDDDLMDHYEKLCLFIAQIYAQYWFSLNNPVCAFVIIVHLSVLKEHFTLSISDSNLNF